MNTTKCIRKKNAYLYTFKLSQNKNYKTIMKRKLLFLFFSLLVGVPLFAQNYRDVVFMKNGSIIKGMVIEQVMDLSLKIKMADGSIFVYQMADVEKIAKEEYDDLFASAKPPKVRRNPKGYRGFMEMGGAFPITEYGGGIFSFQTSHGYQFNPYFYLGGGLSIDYHFYPSTVYVPLFANGRFNFIDNPTTPYFDMKIGYSAGKGKGFYLSPGFGVRFALKDARTAIYFGLGYNMQVGKDYDDCWDCLNTSLSKRKMGAINMRLGIDF